MSLTSLLPWYVRIAAKLVLSRLPVRNVLWHRLNLFSHGSMDRPDYALGVFQSHFDRSDFARKGAGFVALELGPGDSALSAVIAAAHGARACHLIDSGRYASEDPALYRTMARHLEERGMPAPELAGATDLDAVLQACHAEYGTQGKASLQQVPNASVDFIWSQAVLEHIRRAEFLATMKELRRIVRPDGVCSHRVDLKDHLGGGLNNLRIETSLWEREWMASSGFYTNRLRMSEMLGLFAEAGFAAELLGVTQWPGPPLPRHSLAAEFRDLSTEDLCVREFDVLLRPL
jgi:SAM-dependent methyltransferase